MRKAQHMAPAQGRAIPAPRSAPAAVPALTDSRAASVALAAERFVARPEIADCLFSGSNGYGARLPAGTEARLRLWRQWPEVGRCLRLAEALDCEMQDTASPAAVAASVAAMIAAFPTGERSAPGYREAMTAILSDEADMQGWSAAAISRGLLSVVRRSRFLPALAEVIEAVAEAHRDLCFAAWAARQAAELGHELKWGLIDAGVIEDDEGDADV